VSRLLDVDITLRYRSGAVIECAWTDTLDDRNVTVLLGPSGSGKTTMLRCLAGLEQPQRGHIRVGERVWCDAGRRIHVPPEQRDVGLLFQDYALFPHMTVERNVTFGARRLDAVAVRRRLSELLDVFQLKGLERRFPGQLSGGQQQRVALARAVFRRPEVLLLDEPLSALDAATREDLRNELRGLIRSLDIPTYIVTHDRLDALALGDQTILMEEGRIIQRGTTRAVFGNPGTPTAARLVGVDTVLIGQIASVSDGLATVRVGGQELKAEAPTRAGTEVALCIRAEDVMVARTAEGDMSAMNRWHGIIGYETIEGPFVRVVMNCGFRLSALVTRDAWHRLALKQGDPALAIVKAASIRVLSRGSEIRDRGSGNTNFPLPDP
jgi:molybdate transport system ATP-binding protein